MKIIKNKIGSLFQFYDKTKKHLFKKVMIVATCLVCAYAPIHSNVKQVQAIALESAFVAGTVSLLALLGIGIADTVEPDNLYNACSDAIDGFKSFAGQLAGNVATNVTNFIDATVQTGQVALDAFNSLYNELGQITYNVFNGASTEGDTTGFPDLDNVLKLSFIGSASATFLKDNTNYINEVTRGNGFIECSVMNMAWTFTNHELLCIVRDGFLEFSYPSYYGLKRFWNTTSGSTTSDFNRTCNIPFEYISSLVISSSVTKIVFNYIENGVTHVLNYIDGVFSMGDLVLDPPMHQNPDLKLLDESYINYGDINDVAIPRYTGKDAVMNPDGTITDAGTYTLPNYYIPNLERPFPPVIPFPLPGIATIPNEWTGDITKDTPIEDTGDTDITDPDYKVPVVGDFLGDYDVPGKLNWKEYFPFCIPFDLIKFLGVLSADPIAPNFTWNYNIVGTKGSIKIDLSEYETIALVGRTFFDLLFILGLTMATRNLIKG